MAFVKTNRMVRSEIYWHAIKPPIPCTERDRAGTVAHGSASYQTASLEKAGVTECLVNTRSSRVAWSSCNRLCTAAGRGFRSPSMMEDVRIAKYNSAVNVVSALAECSRKLHKMVASKPVDDMSQEEHNIDKLVQKLFRLKDGNSSANHRPGISLSLLNIKQDVSAE